MAWTLTIGGTVINQATANVTLLELTPFTKDGFPTLRFAQLGVALAAQPHPYDAQVVTLTYSGTLVFAGDTGTRAQHYQQGIGWVFEWTCYGLAKRAEYIPVTDALTLTDTCRYNLAPDDPDFLPSRAGRSMGQIVAEVLEMPGNAAPLAAAGLCNYTSAGTGAEAAVTVLTSGAVTTIAIVAGGTGYTTAPTVFLSGGSGSGATATAHVAGGTVTGINVTSGGSGYVTAPVVVLSRLPAVTLADLDALNLLAPFEIDIAGERILQALEGVIQQVHFNHFVQVDPAGNFRVLDPRVFSQAGNQITLTMDLDARVGRPQITVDWSQCYQACLLRGNSLVVPQIEQTKPWPGSSSTDGGLVPDWAHDGMTNAQAAAAWRASDFSSPTTSPGTATGNPTVAGGVVTSIAVGFAGYNYATAPTVLISDATGTGATATATITSGVVTGFTVTAGGTGYSSSPTVTVTGPAVGQQVLGTCTMPNTLNVVITSADHSTQFVADHWDWTDTGYHGTIVLRSDVIADVTQTFTARVVANTAMAPGGTCTITLDTPAPATSYTSFQLFGTSGGASLVYRRYKVTNPAVAGSLANYFPHPVAYRNSDGTAAQLISSPAGTVFLGGQQSGIGIAVDPVAGTVTTSKPTALVFSADGITPVPVSNFQAFLPVFTGSLSTRWPSSGWSGTSHTVLGLARAKTITFLDWRDSSNAANMQLIASEFLDTVKDVVYEGSLPYEGLLPNLLAFGASLNIAGNGYPTGLEGMAAPILSVSLAFNEGREGATSYSMGIQFSNRRAPFSGRALFRPGIVGQPLGLPEATGAAMYDTSGTAQQLAGAMSGAGALKINEQGQSEAAYGQIGKGGTGIGGGPSMGSLAEAAGGSPVTGAAAQAASAGMGDPVTSLASPQEEWGA